LSLRNVEDTPLFCDLCRRRKVERSDAWCSPEKKERETISFSARKRGGSKFIGNNKKGGGKGKKISSNLNSRRNSGARGIGTETCKGRGGMEIDHESYKAPQWGASKFTWYEITRRKKQDCQTKEKGGAGSFHTTENQDRQVTLNFEAAKIHCWGMWKLPNGKKSRGYSRAT